MTLEEVRQMLDKVSLAYTAGIKAYQDGNEAKAEAAMVALRDLLDDCYDRDSEKRKVGED